MSKINLENLSKPISGENLEEFSSFIEYFNENKEKERTSLNGLWKFIYLNKKDIKEEDIESFISNNFDIKELNNIEVPSHIELSKDKYGKYYSNPQYSNLTYPREGVEEIDFDSIPRINPLGVYFKDLVISDYNKKSINNDFFLEFNGFENGLYLYINGEYVGYSALNFERSVFNITKYLKDGNNRIVLFVFKYSFTSWLECQDMWKFHGIFRDVNLIARPKNRIVDIFNNSTLSKEDYKTGLLDLRFTLNYLDKNSELVINLVKGERIVLSETLKVDQKTTIFSREIKNVSIWSDEEPFLYTLKIKLKNNGKISELAELPIGFRCFEIKDSQILLNGKRLFIKGVNRHEFSERSGRVLNIDNLVNDLKLLKKNNFNAIRLCHYPNSHEIYELCDIYGILLCDECGIETHGTWANKNAKKLNLNNVLPGNNTKYEEIFLKKAEYIYKEHKNHPSILFYSLGNESFVGETLRKMYKLLKDLNPNIIIHYEGCSINDDYEDLSDITSRMYPSPSESIKIIKKHPRKPYVLCEFAHSMGNSNGNFDEYINLFKECREYSGGFIWDYLDQGLVRENDNIRFGGDFNDYPNDDNFCANGILLSKRILTSKLDAIKYYYQPFDILLNLNKITIINKYNFKNTARYKFIYQILNKEGNIIFDKSFEANIPPLERKEVALNIDESKINNNETLILRLRVVSKDDTLYLKKGDEIAYEETILNNSFSNALIDINTTEKSNLHIFKSTERVTVSDEKGEFKVVFKGLGTTDNGGLEAIIYNDKFLLNSTVFPTIFRPTIDNDRKIARYFELENFGASFSPLYNPIFRPLKIVKNTSDEVVIEYIYTMMISPSFPKFKIIYHVYSSKIIKVDYSYKTQLLASSPNAIGLSFVFPKEINSFSYLGFGDKETYPDRYKGQKYGRYNSKVENEYIPYSIPQESGNHFNTQEIKLYNNGYNLIFTPVNNSFSFKFVPYSDYQIEIAHRNEELYHRANYLTIYNVQKGVGGDNSWGAREHKPYRIKKNKKYQGSFYIHIEND